jgi:hypothetical protein
VTDPSGNRIRTFRGDPGLPGAHLASTITGTP